MSGTYPNPANSIYSSTYGEVRNYSQAPTYTAYNAPNPYQSVAYPTQPASYSTQPASHPTNPTSYSTQTQAYQIYSDATATSSPSYGETLAGYKPITGEALDLPGQSGSTAKRGGFSSRAPFPSFRQRRGNMGGGGKWPIRKKAAPRPFSCAKLHPVAALKHFHPKAEFTAVCSYHVHEGSAHVYSVAIEDVVYQGEGTTSKIAKAIAAAKALEGIQALDHDKVQVVADYQKQKEEVLKRIQEWQHNHAASEGKKKRKKSKKEEEGGQQAESKPDEVEQPAFKKIKSETVPDGAQIGPIQPTENLATAEQENPGTEQPADNSTSQEGCPVRDYGQLLQRYGPNITEEFSEHQDQGVRFSCTLTIQSFQFTGQNTSKKKARNEAVRLAFLAFEASPPPVVNVKRERVKKVSKKFKMLQPVDFPDMLAEKCWNFASEHLARVQGPYKHLKNLVFVVKMEGEESIENCEVVSFGHGTRLVKMENLRTDGTVVDDCTGDSLALRGLRRYLITQLEACVKKEASVYQSADNNKYTIRDGVQFIFYSTNCPNGDCRTFNLFHRVPRFKRSVSKDTTGEPDQESLDQESSAKGEENEVKENEVKEDKEVTENVVVVETEAKVEVAMNKKEKEAQENSSAEQNTDDGASNKDSASPVKSTRRGGFNPNYRRRVRNFEGKITYAKKDDTEGSREQISLYEEDSSHCIVSPSDKLALRNMCGVQGSLLSEHSSPVFINRYLITLNKYNLTELTKSLYDRVKGAEVPEGVTTTSPEVVGVKWRPTEFLPKTSLFACVWAKGFQLEILYSCEGKQIDGGVENVDWTQTVDPGLFSQSTYSTQQLFKEYTQFCSANSIPCASKYSDIKMKNTGEYQAVKIAVKKHLEQTGMGFWRDVRVPEF